MKKLLLCLTFLFPRIVISQTYHPMLDSVNVWNLISNFIPVAPESTPCYYPYFPLLVSDYLETTGDTIINSLVYKKLMTGSFCEFGYIREDTSAKSVYFMDNTFNPEQKIYDFNMQTGDSINLQFYQPSFFNDGFYVVDSIQVMPTIQGPRNRFFLNCHSCSSNMLTLDWIEGVGNLVFPIYTHADFNLGAWGYWTSCPEFQHQFECFVSCFSHLQLMYFDSCASNLAFMNQGTADWTFVYYDSCNYFENLSGGVNEVNFSSSVSISQNPFREKTLLSIKDPSVHNPVLTIYDLSGKIIFNVKMNSNTIIINRNGYSSGMYLYKIIDSNSHFAFGKLIVE